MPLSNLQNLIQKAQSHISKDASAIVDKFVPDKMKKFLPMLKILNVPKPEIMIETVFQKLAELPEEFWLNIEDMILGVIDGDEEAERKLLQLIGAVAVEN